MLQTTKPISVLVAVLLCASLDDPKITSRSLHADALLIQEPIGAKRRAGEVVIKLNAGRVSSR